MKQNNFIAGDNLLVMRFIPEESVQLVYLDPPYNTNRDWKEFNDRWEGIEHFINYLKPRLSEIKRLLKPSGSLYLQCDSKSVHYLKIALDELFGSENFLNHIIWRRSSNHYYRSKSYDAILDHILFYAKDSKQVYFKPQYKPFRPEYLANDYNKVDSEGRRYKLRGIDNCYGKPGDRMFGSRKVTARIGWVWSQETISKALRDNPDLIHWTKQGRPLIKVYLDEREGNRVADYWGDIPYLSAGSAEITGYPTQKPTKLLRRIVLASSRVGDRVLDPFCGSGTTCVVAKELGRDWVGIDKNMTALKIAEDRIRKTLPSLIGE